MALNRRSLLGRASALAASGAAILKSGRLRAESEEAVQSVDTWPEMTYGTLGNTGFKGSRLVFGCGGALAQNRALHLLEPAFEAGINVFDTGYRGYYRESEVRLAPFLAQRRDGIFLISKARGAPEDFEPSDELSVEQARGAAEYWSSALDRSLRELEVDHVDAYYLMAANNVSLLQSDELATAFAEAKKAGKVSYFGISTHENAQAVLKAAAETGYCSLAQIAITPAGWYEFKTRSFVDGKSMVDLRPVLDDARAAGIGLIGMKAGRHLAAGGVFRWAKDEAYDEYYTPAQMRSGLNAFQRSYAYVLANGLDAVNADMHLWQHLHQNFVAATSGQIHFTTA